jgi:hypothetical protein
MFPDPHITARPEGLPRPDRRPLPRASEIRLRVKRVTSREGA